MTKNLSITIIAVVLLLVVAVIGIVILRTQQSNYIVPPAPQPVATPPSGETPSDSTTQINQSLNDVDLGDLDKEFQQIDADLNSL